MPGPCTFVHCVTAAFFIGSVPGGNFHRFRGFPSRRASASRLPNAGTSLATLLSFANGVVTRRRVQVYTLPLSAPGSLSAPWPPTFLRQAPITAEESRSSCVGWPSCLGTFSAWVRRRFRRLLSLPLPYAVALPSRDSQAYVMGLFTVLTPLWLGGALKCGTTSDPFGPDQCPLAAVHLRQAPTSIGCPYVAIRAFWLKRFGWSFRGLSTSFRPVVLSLAASPSLTVGLTTLLSIANGVVIRRRPQVCTLPLVRSGRSRAPRPPTACAWFPLQAPGCNLLSNGLCHLP